MYGQCKHRLRQQVAVFVAQRYACSCCCMSPQGYQTQDFEGIFRAMDGKPVTIRLLDPPLHEFLPQEVSVVINSYAFVFLFLSDVAWFSSLGVVLAADCANLGRRCALSVY